MLNSETVMTAVRPTMSETAVRGSTPTASAPVATDTDRLASVGDRWKDVLSAGSTACTAYRAVNVDSPAQNSATVMRRKAGEPRRWAASGRGTSDGHGTTLGRASIDASNAAMAAILIRL